MGACRLLTDKSLRTKMNRACPPCIVKHLRVVCSDGFFVGTFCGRTAFLQTVEDILLVLANSYKDTSLEAPDET